MRPQPEAFLLAEVGAPLSITQTVPHFTSPGPSLRPLAILSSAPQLPLHFKVDPRVQSLSPTRPFRHLALVFSPYP